MCLFQIQSEPILDMSFSWQRRKTKKEGESNDSIVLKASAELSCYWQRILGLILKAMQVNILQPQGQQHSCTLTSSD